MRISDWSSDVCSSDLQRYRCERALGQWKLEAIEERRRTRRVVRIMPDYGGAYAWNEQGSSCGLTYIFADFPDVALVEAALEDEWQPRFERAPELAGQHLHPDHDLDAFQNTKRADVGSRILKQVKYSEC